MMKIVAAAVSLAIASSAQAQSPQAIMDRAVKAYADMRSVRAEFRQTITNPLTGSDVVSRGVLLRKDPGLLSITFTDPKGDRVVSDGSSLWIYLPSSAPGQVIRTSAKSNNALAMVDPGGVFLSSPASRFNIAAGGRATIQGRSTNVVSLVPKTSNGLFTKARLWIDASTSVIRQFEVVDANGLKRTVTITSIQTNPNLPASDFRFVPPKGARILDSLAN